jgi:hypothetical protein
VKKILLPKLIVGVRLHNLFHFIRLTFYVITANQSCQILLVTTYQNGKKLPNNHKTTKWPQSIPNSRKILTSSTARPSKINPNRDFWFKNMPSGNPATNLKRRQGRASTPTEQGLRRRPGLRRRLRLHLSQRVVDADLQQRRQAGQPVRQVWRSIKSCPWIKRHDY